MIRHGARAGRTTLVVHLLLDGDSARPGSGLPRAGFVVSKAVGGAVVRNRVARRLRHAVRDLLTTIPAGSMVVVRALPPSATAGPELADDLAGSLTTALKRGQRR